MALKQNLGGMAPDGSVYVVLTDGAGNLGSTVTNSPATASTGTQTSVASSATDVTILAANTNRKGVVIFNDSTQTLFLLFGAGTSSNTNYSVQLASNSYFELPPPTLYTGIIKGIWASANGNARVTEWT